MNRIALITAATLSLTAPAMAYTGVSPTMVSDVESILAEAGKSNVAVSSLSDEQVVEIYFAGQGEDGNERNLKIESALEGEGYRTITERRATLTDMDAETGLMPAGESSVVISVQNWLDKRGYEADASTLTDAQVAEIYFLAFSGDDMDNDGVNKIESILAM
ncbi:hypothetical protein [Jannaschia sp. 2305UL9-9]|uniref:hypothetical protein n=1 Tax=Jannaschia sp. 2305UL9-9 TaxID=3121638 RepID=UPI0035272BB2